MWSSAQWVLTSGMKGGMMNDIARNKYGGFRIYSATSDKLGVAHFRIAWWEKVNVSRSSILHNYIILCRPGYHCVSDCICALKACALVRAIMRNDQNVRVARAMCALCLAAMCRHWGETCGKCNGILTDVDPMWENWPFSPCARWWRYVSCESHIYYINTRCANCAYKD